MDRYQNKFNKDKIGSIHNIRTDDPSELQIILSEDTSVYITNHMHFISHVLDTDRQYLFHYKKTLIKMKKKKIYKNRY